MRKDLERLIEIPEGITLKVEGKDITISGNGKEIKRTFDIGRVSIEAVDSNLKIWAKGSTKREAKMIGTIWAHVKNMIKGINEDFVYTLEICNVHFPMNVKAKGSEIIIKSFLGEKVDRVSKILPNVNVEIKGSKITVSSYDIEAAGQTAANLEKASRSRGRDRRIFQDGIFITNKCGREI